MQKIATQIADKVLRKIAEEGYDDEYEDKELPGYLALRPKSLTEGTGRAMLQGAIPGAASGTLAAAFHPGLARKIPNDKIRLLAGLLGGAGMGAGMGAGYNTLGNSFTDWLSRREEDSLVERGKLTPEQVQQNLGKFNQQR